MPVAAEDPAALRRELEQKVDAGVRILRTFAARLAAVLAAVPGRRHDEAAR